MKFLTLEPVFKRIGLKYELLHYQLVFADTTPTLLFETYREAIDWADSFFKESFTILAGKWPSGQYVYGSIIWQRCF